MSFSLLFVQYKKNCINFIPTITLSKDLNLKMFDLCLIMKNHFTQKTHLDHHHNLDHHKSCQPIYKENLLEASHQFKIKSISIQKKEPHSNLEAITVYL